MVGYFDPKHRCLIEKNVSIELILPSRWRDGTESLGMEHTSCLCWWIWCFVLKWVKSVIGRAFYTFHLSVSKSLMFVVVVDESKRASKYAKKNWLFKMKGARVRKKKFENVFRKFPNEAFAFVSSSVTRLGDFYLLGNKFSYKCSPNIQINFWAILNNTTFM